MRIGHRYFVFDSQSTIIKPVRSLLDTYNISYKYKEDLHSVVSSFSYSIDFLLFEDHPSFWEIKHAVDEYELTPQTGTFYEKADLEQAKWFIASAGHYQFPQPENQFGYLQTTFNLESYCNLCGIGKVQNAPYRLKSAPKQFNSQFWGLHWEYEPLFVRQETKAILEQESIAGIRFTQPVLHKKNIVIEGFYQLHVDTVLKPGFDNYNTKAITCKINNEENCNTNLQLTCCGRIKFHHPMIGGYLFEEATFDTDSNIAYSHEYFGSGGSANRLLLVSKRIKQLIEKHQLKGLAFTPVVHERLNRS